MKVAKPDYFHGERNKLDDWVNQMMMYFVLEGISNEPKRTLIATSFLRGEAQHWIRPKLTRMLEDRTDTDGIFTTWDGFTTAIRNVYGLSNDKQVAIRMIQHLTQKSSASQYTAKFQEYSTKTEWDNQALMTMYYRGLKESVKDELMRYGHDQSTLANMMKAAIEVDDALYERFMEKRHTGQFRGRSGYATSGRTVGQQRRDLDAMELDSTQPRPRKGKDGGRGKQHAPGKKRNGPECYNCHKVGHYARDCRGKKMRPLQEVNVMSTSRDNDPPTDKGRGAYDTSHQTTKETDHKHAVLHWRFCYEDQCQTHYSSKRDSGYFPHKPRKELNVLTTRQTNQQTRDDGTTARGRSPPPFAWEDTTLHEHQTPSPQMEPTPDDPTNTGSTRLPTPEVSPMRLPQPLLPTPLTTQLAAREAEQLATEESSEEEYTDDDEPDDNELIYFSVEGPNPIKKMILHIAQRHEEVFPKIQGKRRLNPHEFDYMQNELRRMFWNYRKINVEYNARLYVQDKPPMGSHFRTDGGYVAPDGTMITRTMRERVMTAKQRFGEMQQIQERWQNDEIDQGQLNKEIRDSMHQWIGTPPGQYLQPVWKAMILGHIKTTTKGPVNVQFSPGKVTLSPRQGPLHWEVSLESASSPTYFSKNE